MPSPVVTSHAPSFNSTPSFAFGVVRKRRWPLVFSKNQSRTKRSSALSPSGDGCQTISWKSVFFADRIHHLSHEQFEAAAFVGVDRVRDDDLIVEMFEHFLLLESLLVTISALFRECDDFKSVAGDVLLAL